MKCQHCRSRKTWRYGTIKRKVLDRRFGDLVEMIITTPRYICRACNRTFSVPPPGLGHSARYGSNLTSYIHRQTAYRTLESVADELGLSMTTIQKYATKKSRIAIEPAVIEIVE